MKKIAAVCMCGSMAAALMARCGKKVTVDSVRSGRYKGMGHILVPVEVTNEQVEAEVQELLDEHTVETEVDHAAKEGGIVNADFVGMKGGVAFGGGASSGYDLKLGSGSFADGFEDGPIDVVKGQELDLSLTLLGPCPSNEELAGQGVVFDVAVSAVKGSKPTELNGTFIKENTEPAMVDEYREVTRESLLAAAQADADDRKKSEIFQKVVDSSEVIVADATVGVYYNKRLSNYGSQAPQAGIDLETMVGCYGSDLGTFKFQPRAMSEEISKRSLVAKTITDAEGITIAEENEDTLAIEFGYADKDSMVEIIGDIIMNSYILTEKVVLFIADNTVEA